MLGHEIYALGETRKGMTISDGIGVFGSRKTDSLTEMTLCTNSQPSVKVYPVPADLQISSSLVSGE